MKVGEVEGDGGVGGGERWDKQEEEFDRAL